MLLICQLQSALMLGCSKGGGGLLGVTVFVQMTVCLLLLWPRQIESVQKQKPKCDWTSCVVDSPGRSLFALKTITINLICRRVHSPPSTVCCPYRLVIIMTLDNGISGQPTTTAG